MRTNTAITPRRENRSATGEGGNVIPFNFIESDTPFLIEYIVHTYHDRIRQTLPVLIDRGSTLNEREGNVYPCIQAILGALVELNSCIKHHLTSEEYAFFPYILEMEHIRNCEQPFAAAVLGQIEKPVSTFEKEHSACTGLLDSICNWSGEFIPPANATPEHRSWYGMLKEFDTDMRLHMRIENDILFPRALALEAELLARKGFAPVLLGRRAMEK
jgi:regulator of cell morphogenesis and NO signaling